MSVEKIKLKHNSPEWLAEKLGDDIEAAIRQLAERRRNKE